MQNRVETSLHLVDPELRPGLEIYPKVPLDREVLRQIRRQTFPKPEYIDDGLDVEVTRHSAPSAGSPDVPLIAYRPCSAPDALPCLFYIHGGGFVSGSAAMMGAQHRSLCAELRAVVVAVDYRLAPETPYPGPLEDCYAGLSWVVANRGQIGVDEKKIAICGNSAGGGLAAGLTLLARDRGEISPAFQYLLNPMLDDRTGKNGPPHSYAGEFVWNAANNRFGWRCYLGECAEAATPAYAAPARATSLDGLPPTFLCTGALDLFVEETLEYGRRLIEAGVTTELHIIPGAYHGSSIVTDAYPSKMAERIGRAALSRAFD